jgi:hypothetical protein
MRLTNGGHVKRKQTEPVSTALPRSLPEQFWNDVVVEHRGDDILEALQSLPDKPLQLDKRSKEPSVKSIRSVLEERSALERLKADKKYAEIVATSNSCDQGLRALLRDRTILMQRMEDFSKVENDRSNAREVIRRIARQKADELLQDFKRFLDSSPILKSKGLDSQLRAFLPAYEKSLMLKGHRNPKIKIGALKKRLQRASTRKS